MGWFLPVLRAPLPRRPKPRYAMDSQPDVANGGVRVRPNYGPTPAASNTAGFAPGGVKTFFKARARNIDSRNGHCGNNDSRVHNCRVYCCADALAARVFTQVGPQADAARTDPRIGREPRIPDITPAYLESWEGAVER